MHLLPGCRSTFVQRSTGIGSGTINRNRRTAAADGRKFLDSTIGHLISAGTDLAAQDAKGVRHRDIHTDPAHADATIGVIGAAREIWGTAALSGRRSEVGLLRVGMSERREGSKRGRDGEEEGGRHDSAEPLRTRSAWRDRRDCKNPSERCRVGRDEGKRREAEHACLPGLRCALPGTRSRDSLPGLAPKWLPHHSPFRNTGESECGEASEQSSRSQMTIRVLVHRCATGALSSRRLSRKLKEPEAWILPVARPGHRALCDPNVRHPSRPWPVVYLIVLHPIWCPLERPAVRAVPANGQTAPPAGTPAAAGGIDRDRDWLHVRAPVPRRGVRCRWRDRPRW